MQRWDIINHLIRKNQYTSYLEIGYYKGWSFDRVECEFKVAVDPNPSKTQDQANLVHGDLINTVTDPGTLEMPELYKSEQVCKMTSDEFFAIAFVPAEFGELSDQLLKWDIIFIDGLHESSQVDRDIQNALKHLNPGGTIVMHDCNPSSYEMTTTGTANGEWTGDVYKSFVKVYSSHLCECYVVDTDYGVGVIKPQSFEIKPLLEHLPKVQYGDEGYEEFSKHRKIYLNLISPEEFLAKEKIVLNVLEL